MKRLLFSLPLFVLLSTGAAIAAKEGWSSDFAASCKQAAEAKKDLLINFTGSDWCGWCIKLDEEVFSHGEFKDGVKDKFILVELDYPRDSSKLSKETIKQNEELKTKYSIEGYPTILLCDATGKPYAKTGYEAGGPVKYVTHLDELRKKKALRDEALATASKTQGVEKAKALVAMLNAIELDDAMVAAFYGSVRDEIKAADPKDETGFAKAGADKVRFEAFFNEVNEFASNKDLDGAMALVDKNIKEGGFSKEDTQQIMMIRCTIFLQQKKFDEAIKAAEDAKAFLPNSNENSKIDAFIKQIEAGKAKAAAKSEGKADDKVDAKPDANIDENANKNADDEGKSDKAPDPN